MKEIPRYKFYKRKYGAELLVDVIDIDAMKNDINRTPVYCTTFYSIILFTDGDEEIALNGQRLRIKPGIVACSCPGEVWSWQSGSKLKGLHLLFEEEFLLSFFNDRLFLSKFPFLQAGRRSPFLQPDEYLFRRLLRLCCEMRSEIDEERPDKDRHILRAMLYETLMLLNRAEQASPSGGSAKKDVSVLRYVETFRRLVDEDFMHQHEVEYYAGRLCITSNYLNKIIRQHLGVSTKQYILNKVIGEAKRLLSYTSLSVTEISESLHFDEPTYFVRLFRKYVGCTPNCFRTNNQCINDISPEK